MIHRIDRFYLAFKVFWISLLVLLFLTVLFYGFKKIQSSINGAKPEKIIENNNDVFQERKIIGTEEVEDQFDSIPEMHLTEMPIKYRISNPAGCGDFQIGRIKQAMFEIENASDGKVRFEETSYDESMIIICKDRIASEIYCKDLVFSADKKSFNAYTEGGLNYETQEFYSSTLVKKNYTNIVYQVCYVNVNFRRGTLWEAGPTSVFSNKIRYTEVHLYEPVDGWSSCSDFPVREVQGLLYSMGFMYDPAPRRLSGYEVLQYLNSIMSPYINCKYNKGIDDRISVCLKYIYTNGKEYAGLKCNNVIMANPKEFIQ